MAFQKEKMIYGRGRTNNYGTPGGLIEHTYASSDDLHAVISAPGYFDDFLGASTDDVKLNDLVLTRDSNNAFKTYRLDTLSPVTVTSVEPGGNPFNQSLNTTDAVTFLTVDTGQGANDLYAMNQNVRTSDAVSFATVNTGHGANELYEMDQNVKTTDSPTFVDMTTTGSGIKFPTSGGTPTFLSYYEVLAPIAFTWTGAFTAPQAATVHVERIGNIVHLLFEGVFAPQNSTALVTSTSAVLPVNFRPSSLIELSTFAVEDNALDFSGELTIVSTGVMSVQRLLTPPFTGVGNLAFPRFAASFSII